MSPQARGSAGGRRRHDAASQEDHDKPYVCDSKYLLYCLSPGFLCHFGSHANAPALVHAGLCCFQLPVVTFPPAVARLWA